MLTYYRCAGLHLQVTMTSFQVSAYKLYPLYTWSTLLASEMLRILPGNRSIELTTLTKHIIELVSLFVLQLWLKWLVTKYRPAVGNAHRLDPLTNLCARQLLCMNTYGFGIPLVIPLFYGSHPSEYWPCSALLPVSDHQEDRSSPVILATPVENVSRKRSQRTSQNGIRSKTWCKGASRSPKKFTGDINTARNPTSSRSKSLCVQWRNHTGVSSSSKSTSAWFGKSFNPK